MKQESNYKFPLGETLTLRENYHSIAAGSEGKVTKRMIRDGAPCYRLHFGFNAGGQKLEAAVPETYLSYF